MISCEQAAIICDKTQYKEASITDRLKLEFHLFTCKSCSSYSEKNAKLTSLCKKAKLNSLSEEEKKRMKIELKNKI